MKRVWALVVAILASLIFAGWASDFVTPQGERTVYTVDCREGVWKEDRCSGRIVSGPRYRYRALKPHGEVIFWTVGTNEPSGKFSGCSITDGRNWICPPNADAVRSITLKMDRGAPVSERPGVTFPCRHVPKWRWFLLDAGLAVDPQVQDAQEASSAPN